MKDSKPGPPRATDNSWLVFLNLGWIIAGTMTLTLLGGIWLDGRFGTQPLFIVIGVVLGFVLCGWSVYRAVKKTSPEPPPKPRN